MAGSQEGPNPLRPYYIPPSIGPPPEVALSSSHGNVTAGVGRSSMGTTQGKPSFSSSARDIFSDIDYSDYISGPSPSSADLARNFLDQALWKYTSVLLAQPFEVAKTILQCNIATSADLSRSRGERRRDRFSEGGQVYDDDIPSDDSDVDDSAYFSSTAPSTQSHYASLDRRNLALSDDGQPQAPQSSSSVATSGNKLVLTRPSAVLEAISQLWIHEGAWGVWKASNTSFIYNVLLKTIESWTRSLLVALFNVPDPRLLAGTGIAGVGVEVLESPYPLASLGCAVAAAAVAGLALAPLDLVRTRLILTPTSQPPRAMLPSLRSLPRLSCPTSLVPITLLTSVVPTLFSTSTPLLLRYRFGVDPVLTPSAYSFFTFVSSTAELFIRLPLETVLRRGQIHTAISMDTAQRMISTIKKPKMSTIVDIGPYRGVVGTMWSIVKEEGTRPQDGKRHNATTPGSSRKAEKAEKRGQGIEGLWRGWRVGMWGLVGMWGAAALGGAAKGGEF